MTVGIIGCGNMGSAIARAAKQAMFGVGAYDLHPEKVADAGAELRTLDRVTMADLVVIAVKPQDFPGLAREMKKVEIGTESIIVSIMAGVPLARLRELLGTDRVVRSMPNLAAAVSESMTVWFSDSSLTKEEKEEVRALFTAMGGELEVQSEEMIDAAGIIAGCSPGWFYNLLALLSEEAERLGFSSDQASLLVRQMFVGAAELARDGSRSFLELRDAVASRGGITEAGLKAFEGSDFQGLIRKVVDTAVKKSKELVGN